MTGGTLCLNGAGRLRIIDIGGPTVESTARFNASLGFEPDLLWSYYITGLELVGGLLLVLGLLTRPATLLFTGLLVVATFYVTPRFGFWSRDGDVQYAALLLVLILSILVRGDGAYSLDRRIGRGF
ncbi:DoxX family membrane protein [Roseomonas populi]|uniref:DoxX family membrane protein n=1 Tax=Roseomonas populi TaxID=3121582 RepID=A0ABT1XA91_9PROT|nr:DoxX family membrane protein [Roseomonas pecuniae]MCR0985002.1 DoxX family membrane protein [Roseomonas pecuniae]